MHSKFTHNIKWHQDGHNDICFNTTQVREKKEGRATDGQVDIIVLAAGSELPQLPLCCWKYTLENTEGAMKKGKSRETWQQRAHKTKKNKAKTQHNMEDFIIRHVASYYLNMRNPCTSNI